MESWGNRGVLRTQGVLYFLSHTGNFQPFGGVVQDGCWVGQPASMTGLYLHYPRERVVLGLGLSRFACALHLTLPSLEDTPAAWAVA